MAAVFYEARLAGLPVWIASISTDAGRTVVEHLPTVGDEVELDDRGQAPLRARVELLFAERPGLAPAADRLRELAAKVAKGDPDGFWFTHPILGTYRAAVSDFTFELRGTIASATCTLIRKGAPTAVEPLGPGVAVTAGVEAVSTAADQVKTELAAVDLETDVGTSAIAAITAWPDAPARQVFLDAATLSAQIQDEIARLELLADLELWPAYKALIGLADSVRSAAEAATSAVPRTFRLLVSAPVALRALVARVYGGRLAAERYEQVVALNDLSTPGRVPAGTTLVMPALAPAPRRA